MGKGKLRVTDVKAERRLRRLLGYFLHFTDKEPTWDLMQAHTTESGSRKERPGLAKGQSQEEGPQEVEGCSRGLMPRPTESQKGRGGGA